MQIDRVGVEFGKLCLEWNFDVGMNEIPIKNSKIRTNYEQNCENNQIGQIFRYLWQNSNVLNCKSQISTVKVLDRNKWTVVNSNEFCELHVAKAPFMTIDVKR